MIPYSMIIAIELEERQSECFLFDFTGSLLLNNHCSAQNRELTIFGFWGSYLDSIDDNRSLLFKLFSVLNDLHWNFLQCFIWLFNLCIGVH